MFIRKVIPGFIKNSRGERTVQIELVTYEGRFKASAPSGKSKGKHEVPSYNSKGIETYQNRIEKYKMKLKNQKTSIKIINVTI